MSSDMFERVRRSLAHPCDINPDKGGIRTHHVEMRDKMGRFYTCVHCGEAVIVKKTPQE